MKDEFVRVIEENRNAIKKICYLYEFNRDLRDDLYQEILLQLWKSFQSFRGDSSVSTWVYRVALNTAISYSKKELKKKEISAGELPVSVTEEEMTRQKDDKEWLFAALQQLSVTDRTLVLLYLDEVPYEEISQILGLTVNNLRVKMNRIKAKLKVILSQI